MRGSTLFFFIILFSLLPACATTGTQVSPPTPASLPTIPPTIVPLTANMTASPTSQATSTTVPITPSATPLSPVPTSTTGPALLAHKNALGGFPFPVGTTWVYLRAQYSQVGSGSTNIITATNLLTETVMRTVIITPAVAIQLKQTASLVAAQPGWEDNSSNWDEEFWYLIVDNRIFTSPEQPTSAEPPKANIKGEQSHALVYAFPLVEGQSWCPLEPPPSYNPRCVAMGRQTVVHKESYVTPVGTFDECYEITQDYNSGGVTEWFCNGVGVVARKYDHGGTRFGFEDILIRYISK